MTRLEQEYAWLHVAATAIIRRLVEGHDEEALLAAHAFLEEQKPTPGEYVSAVRWESYLRQAHAERIDL